MELRPGECERFRCKRSFSPLLLLPCVPGTQSKGHNLLFGNKIRAMKDIKAWLPHPGYLLAPCVAVLTTRRLYAEAGFPVRFFLLEVDLRDVVEVNRKRATPGVLEVTYGDARTGRALRLMSAFGSGTALQGTILLSVGDEAGAWKHALEQGPQ
jgi:hypothetical protein